MNYIGYLRGYMPVISRAEDFDNLSSSEIQIAKEQLDTDVLTTNEELEKIKKEYPKNQKEVFLKNEEDLLGIIIECDFYEVAWKKRLSVKIGITEEKRILYEKIKKGEISILELNPLELNESFVYFDQLIIESVEQII